MITTAWNSLDLGWASQRIVSDCLHISDSALSVRFSEVSVVPPMTQLLISLSPSPLWIDALVQECPKSYLFAFPKVYMFPKADESSRSHHASSVGGPF